MKKRSIIISLGLVVCMIAIVNGCKKTPDEDPITQTGLSTSYTEEFDDFVAVNNKGWVSNDFSGVNTYAGWGQGSMSFDKGGVWHGFAAYAWINNPTEFAYSYCSNYNTNSSVSSWFISPTLLAKNGDKISFYTRGDTVGPNINRMQVRLAKTTDAYISNDLNSVGKFTTLLFDINPNQVNSGYPTSWTKYEYTFSGLSKPTDVRIGFRHYFLNVSTARGVGIDQFKFQVN